MDGVELFIRSARAGTGYDLPVKQDIMDKTKAMAGFFSSISFRMDRSAADQLEAYAIRNEQEKYFEEMKDQLGFYLQRNSSEDEKTGRLFILFIGLILRSRIRYVWDKSLKDAYPSSVDVLYEMVSNRYNEYEDGT